VLNAWHLTARFDCDLCRQASALCCRPWAPARRLVPEL